MSFDFHINRPEGAEMGGSGLSRQVAEPGWSGLSGFELNRLIHLLAAYIEANLD